MPTGDGEVEGGAVGYFAVVVEEPEIAADEGGEADEVLWGVGGVSVVGEEGWGREGRKGKGELTVTGSMTSQPKSVSKVMR